MVQLFLVKTLITFVTGCTLGQLFVASITDSPIKKEPFYILAVTVTMNAIIETIRM